MKTRIVGLCFAAVLVCVATTAHADPVTITTGHIYHNSDFGPDGAQLQLQLPDAMLETFVFMDPLSGTSFGALLQPGATVTFNTRVTRFVDELGTSATGTLQFMADPVVVPSMPPPPHQNAQLDTTFSMTGFLSVLHSGVLGFSGDVNGIGSLNVLLIPEPDAAGHLQFFLESATFTFNNGGASPTPEPATTALFALGLVAVGGAKRLKRR